MKLKLMLLFIPALFLFSTMAHAQSAPVLQNTVSVLEMSEHPQHAEQHPMATEHPLVGGGSDTYTYGHGEQPLWEFPNPKENKPLGDIAREYRQQKLATRKASLVLEQVGDKQ